MNFKNATLLFFLLLACFSRLEAQISPGELVNAHAPFEGMSNCTKCHDFGKQVSSTKCLDCHTEIKNLIAKGRGYHASSEVKSQNCFACHKDHHGRNFQIIRFDTKNFDHRKTAFELSGKHGQLKCADCHQTKFIKVSKYRSKQGTWIGLETQCVNCHEDFHRKSLGENCSGCHNTTSFKTVAKFDHSKTKFPLTGKHSTLDCTKCHTKEVKDGKPSQKFTGLPFGNCTPCHKDFHSGKFGTDCKKCHSTQSFHQVNSKEFDHGKTNYPLLGKHRTVACESCHGKSNSFRPKHENCVDCHKDFHKGQLTDGDGKTRNCNLCHTIEGFSPSLFSIDKHALLKFQLTGSHLSIPCVQCHHKQTDWQFRIRGERCVNCHKNIHGNEISSKFMVDDACEVCHNNTSWKQITFAHDSTKFPLLGKHAKASCARCHVWPNSAGEKTYKFASLNLNCEGCHKDIHLGQFREWDNNNCLRCHVNDSWDPVKFDHNRTSFTLIGAHAKVECVRCHKEVHHGNERYILYKLGDAKCVTCHA